MNRSVLRGTTMIVVLALALTGCAAQSTVASGSAVGVAAPSAIPTATLMPTIAVTPTARATDVPRIADDVQIAGIAVGNLTTTEAMAQLQDALAPMSTPLEIRTDTVTTTINPTDVGLQLPYEQMVAEALVAPSGARMPLRASYDQARVQAALQALAAQVATQASFGVIVGTAPISRSFVVTPGLRLDTDTGARLIGTSLRTLGSTRTISLSLIPDVASGRPTPEQLQTQIEQAASNWKGIVGMYVYDLDQGSVVAQLNPDTVFSGASVMKVPIMLQTYLSLPSFTANQERWLQQMIIDSDNWSANQLLAASVGGSGVLAALEGTEKMTAMLQNLGLQHTYQYSPYQSKDFLLKRNVKLKAGPAREGSEPYTAADPRLRTTPAEMSTVFLLIQQCSSGSGKLLEQFSDKLTPARCAEMIERLRHNADRGRMVSGFPNGTDVAHKSGWIDDMQADVGIVSTPGGNFLVAIYVYQKQSFADASRAVPAIGQLARLVYTYYNPLVR